VIQGFLLLRGQDPQVVAEPSWDADAIARRLGSAFFCRERLGHDAMNGAALWVLHLMQPASGLHLDRLRPCLVLATIDGLPVDVPIDDVFALAASLVAREAGVPYSYPQNAGALGAPATTEGNHS
jgi:hypothetical protein